MNCIGSDNKQFTKVAICAITIFILKLEKKKRGGYGIMVPEPLCVLLLAVIVALPIVVSVALAVDVVLPPSIISISSSAKTM